MHDAEDDPLCQKIAADGVVSEPSHRACIVCGCDNQLGMHVGFHSQADGSVTASFFCGDNYQGYPELLHGGIVAALLDGAMTNCLFAHDIVAVTAEMTIRYVLPVRTGHPSTVRAWIVKSSPRLQFLAAELLQDGSVRAKATAKFRDTISGLRM